MSEQNGGFFEDFAEGMTYRTGGRTVTETDIVNFAGLSGDFNPIHTDAAYASTTMFQQRIAHGLLGLSMASGLATHLGFMGDKVEAFLGLEWKFRAPIFIGDTIHDEVRVTALRAMPRLKGGVVTFGVSVVKQDGTTVQRGEWQILFKSRSQAEADAGAE